LPRTPGKVWELTEDMGIEEKSGEPKLQVTESVEGSAVSHVEGSQPKYGIHKPALCSLNITQ